MPSEKVIEYHLFLSERTEEISKNISILAAQYWNTIEDISVAAVQG